jgi:hypothetical protein
MMGGSAGTVPLGLLPSACRVARRRHQPRRRPPPDGILDRGRRVGSQEALDPIWAQGVRAVLCSHRPTVDRLPGRLPPCEICTGPSRKELRGVEDRGRHMRNPRSVAGDGRIGGHDPPRFAGGLPGRYGHRLLPVCCPGAAVARTFATQSEPAARRRVKTGGARTWRGTGLAG